MPNTILNQEANVANLCARMNMENLLPEIDLASRKILSYNLTRPALQLTGFFDYFQGGRVMIFGQAEQQYLDTLEKPVIRERIARIASYEGIPCFIFTRGYHPCDGIIEICREEKLPILISPHSTGETTSELIRWLRVLLAPRTTLHGVLIDVYGEGVLIMGDSGIGKSEAALELVKRGHRLVSDDVVEIRKVSDETLVGVAPEMTKDFIELRGIGIINVRAMFGFEAVKQSQNIDMVINLEEYKKDKKFDRLGLEDTYMEILGNKVRTHNIPIRPGRNIAIIVESAAVNNRAKKMGYSAPEEFFKRVNAEMKA
ncbi:MAG: HPr(Ser) kinase/phosphatase [Lachnospiraceae bacterium]|nr:HPr(Ser) kinase/phosphatase [Lachnospiraceae bacterium]MBR2532993.1 HPr(Ser) kinase/phosphatase [Lachnospiraceae bacterium]